MFVIFKNKELYHELWNNHTFDNLLETIELNLELIDTFYPALIHKEDIYLAFIDEDEGLIGKVTFSHSSNNNDILMSFDKPTTDSALIIRDIGYHIDADSNIHDDADKFEELTHKFYQSILKNALWICRKLLIKNIITISDNIDDHKDLSFWGGFDFLTHWEFNNNTIGIIPSTLKDSNQLQDIDTFLHSIRYVSYDELL
ncbi:MAG: hypothetical protein BGO77_07435 [Caedibacter sp. 37-49]|nr:MAG: hypothetical protein BGO77_07435 [Caedibacter sp. 37-49]